MRNALSGAECTTREKASTPNEVDALVRDLNKVRQELFRYSLAFEHVRDDANTALQVRDSTHHQEALGRIAMFSANFANPSRENYETVGGKWFDLDGRGTKA
jgi:hypothetical protein